MAPEGVAGGTEVSEGASGAAGASGASGSGATGALGATGVSGSGNPNPADKSVADAARERAGFLADLKKERQARQDMERRFTEHEARLAERDRQIAALTGTKTPSKEEAEADAVRERFAALFPGLAKLTDTQIEKLLAVADRGDQLDETTKNYWTNHGRTMLDNAHAGIAKELGDLTPRQKDRINAAYYQLAENDPEFLKRHEAGDPKLIQEFVKDYLDDFVEPVRRKVTATEVARQRQVPFGKDRTLPSSGGKTIDVNDNKAVMDMLVESRKGQFSRR